MPDRFPGYDVLAKRHTPSWNEKTRRVIDARLSLPRTPCFLSEQEWAVLEAICARIVPQPHDRAPVPVASQVDHKLLENAGDGYRPADLPPLREAWRRGLRALDAEARRAHGIGFAALDPAAQDGLLGRAQEGELSDEAWGEMPAKLFFEKRMAKDIVAAYYAFPTAWNEIGFGGPASPRGYVRMGFDRRDPWEAAEVKDGDVADAERKNRRVG